MRNRFKKIGREIIRDIYVAVLLFLARAFMVLKRAAVEEEKSLLIVKIDGIGDYILFRNFLRLIRESDKFRGHRITLCANAAVRSLGEWLDAGDVDEFIWLDREGLHRNPFRLLNLVLSWKRKFSSAIQPTYSRSFLGDLLIELSGAKEKIGFRGDASNISAGEKKQTDSWYTRLIDTESRFEFEKNRDFFSSFLGESIGLKLPVIDLKEDLKEKGLEENKIELPKKYAVIFPGAGQPFRQWPIGKFAQLSSYLSGRYDLKPVVCGGPGDEGMHKKIAAAAKGSLNLIGKTDLKQLVQIIRGAELLVTNDTSAAHIGQAVGTQMLVFYQFNHYPRFLYPKETPRVIYLAPPHPETEEELILKYCLGSDANIDLISFEAAVSAVDQLLSPAAADDRD